MKENMGGIMHAHEFAQRIKEAKAQSNGWWSGCCPSHNDKNPSLGFKDGDKGLVLKCHGGCTIDDICRALNMKVSDLFHTARPNESHRKKQIVATYDYRDETATLLYQTVRYDPKDFRQRGLNGAGKRIWKLQNARLVLYRLPELVQANSVLIVEGEKDVETGYDLGLPPDWAATTSPMGAGKWQAMYSEMLTGKSVVICPDTDEVGRKHGEQVANSLEAIALSVRRLTWTLRREADNDLLFGPIIFYDGAGFLVPAAQGVDRTNGRASAACRSRPLPSTRRDGGTDACACRHEGRSEDQQYSRTPRSDLPEAR